MKRGPCWNIGNCDRDTCQYQHTSPPPIKTIPCKVTDSSYTSNSTAATCNNETLFVGKGSPIHSPVVKDRRSHRTHKCTDTYRKYRESMGFDSNVSDDLTNPSSTIASAPSTVKRSADIEIYVPSEKISKANEWENNVISSCHNLTSELPTSSVVNSSVPHKISSPISGVVDAPTSAVIFECIGASPTSDVDESYTELVNELLSEVVDQSLPDVSNEPLLVDEGSIVVVDGSTADVHESTADVVDKPPVVDEVSVTDVPIKPTENVINTSPLVVDVSTAVIFADIPPDAVVKEPANINESTADIVEKTLCAIEINCGF